MIKTDFVFLKMNNKKLGQIIPDSLSDFPHTFFFLSPKVCTILRTGSGTLNLNSQ
jgi:hypothetical protein